MVVFGISGSEHIEIITEIIAVPMGVPVDVTVGLAIATVTFAVVYPFLKAIASTFFHSCTAAYIGVPSPDRERLQRLMYPSCTERSRKRDRKISKIHLQGFIS